MFVLLAPAKLLTAACGKDFEVHSEGLPILRISMHSVILLIGRYPEDSLER